MTINRLNILDELIDDEYSSSIILTYSVDLYFYEHVVLRRLKQMGCKNNVVFMDGGAYNDIIDQYKNDISLAGRHYSLRPIYQAGCFHPKIIFLVSQTKIKIIIGSGNLNLGGYSINNETFVNYNLNIDDANNYPFIRSVWSFIKGFNKTSSEFFLYRQLSAIESEYPWLLENNKEVNTVTSENVTSKLFYHKPQSTILQQFLSYLKDKSVSEITIISPFFDEECKALKTIGKSFPAAKINVIIKPNDVNLNSNSFPKSDQYKLYEYKDEISFLHAKIYYVTSNKGSQILVGSSNCTNNGLGTIDGRSQNIEACVMLESNDKSIFNNSLGLNSILIKDNLLERSILKNISFEKRNHKRFNYGINLVNLEYKNGVIKAEISNYSTTLKYSLILDANNDQEIYESDRLEGKTILVYKVNQESIANYRVGYIKTDNDERSNSLFISSYLQLQQNAPSSRSAKMSDIIHRMENEGADWIELIDNLDDIFFHDQTIKHFNLIGNKQNNENENTGDVDDQYISYEEFLSRTKPYDKIKSVESFSANSSDFGVLTSFILRQFNIIPQSVDTETGGEEKEIDISLYNEETGEEVDDSKDDAKQKKTKKNLKSEEDRRNAKYYRNKVKKLSRRYIEYLDVLTKGDKEKNIDPPSVLSINELSKFNLMATIINYYAGKTIGDEEIFYMDGDSDDSYWGLMTTIIWKCFCYTNEGEDHYPVIRKVMFDKIYSEIPIDFHFTVTMAAFSICVLIEFFRKDEDLRKLQIAAYRLYYNTGLDTKTYSAIDINDAFSKYYSKAGFFDYRNIREEKYLHFDKIYAQHEIIADRMKNIRKQLQGIQKRYDDNIGNHPRVRKGSYIWTPKTGLSYVVDVHGSSLVVFDWGLESGMGDEIKYMQGYVIEIKIDDK